MSAGAARGGLLKFYSSHARADRSFSKNPAPEAMPGDESDSLPG
jgi:hypothetical protein